MRRVLCIWIPDWPLARLAIARPELAGRAILVYEPQPQGGLKVVGYSPGLTSLETAGSATESPPTVMHGLYAGMPLAEATALLAHQQITMPSAPHLKPPHLEPADPTADRLALIELALCCQQFSPVVGLEESPRPDCLLLDVTGLAHLFGSESALVAQVARAFAARGLSIRAAVANTLGAAWAVAHSESQSPLQVIPPGETFTALAPLPIAWLRIADETIDLLDTLGLHRLGQVVALPRAALLSRFGPELLRRIDQALGQSPEPIVAHHLPREFAADYTFEYPTTRRDAIELVLEQLLPRVTDPLFRRRQGMLELDCRFICEGKDRSLTSLQSPPSPLSLSFSIGLFRPTASAGYLHDLLRLRLESIRLRSPVVTIRISVTASGPLEQQQQQLFEPDESQQEPRELSTLVDRLTNRLGRTSVVQVMLLPDAQPEYACIDVPLTGASAWQPSRTQTRGSLLDKPAVAPGKSAGGRGTSNSVARKKSSRKQKLSAASPRVPAALSFAADERPLHMYPQPLRIEVLRWTRRGMPAQFRLAGQVHAVACCWGPERIETGWWRTEGSEGEQRGVSSGRGESRIEDRGVRSEGGARRDEQQALNLQPLASNLKPLASSLTSPASSLQPPASSPQPQASAPAPRSPIPDPAPPPLTAPSGSYVRRDYYRIETTVGSRFWVYRQINHNAWFVHAAFE